MAATPVGSSPSTGPMGPRPEPMAQLAPGEQEKIQGAMLKVAKSNREHLANELAKPSAELIATETQDLQEKRASDVTFYDGLIATDEKFAQTSGNPDFWNEIKQKDIQKKGEVLAEDDQLIATVAQREPEIRADLQQDINYMDTRIAELQAGPVPITQSEANAYRQLIQMEERAAARPPAQTGYAVAGYGQDSFSAAGATRPAVAGLFG
jgi:hypothetical protein